MGKTLVIPVRKEIEVKKMEFDIGLDEVFFGAMILFVAGFIVLMVLVIQPYPLIEYGQGSTFGVMTTIEEGMFFDSVWIRADYESSNTDRYCMRKNSGLKEVMKHYIEQNKRVELEYSKSFFGQCSEVVTRIDIVGDNRA